MAGTGPGVAPPAPGARSASCPEVAGCPGQTASAQLRVAVAVTARPPSHTQEHEEEAREGQQAWGPSGALLCPALLTALGH